MNDESKSWIERMAEEIVSAEQDYDVIDTEFLNEIKEALK